MKFIKSSIISILGIIFLISLTGCKNFSANNSGKDYLKIYNANDKIIKTLNGKKSTNMLKVGGNLKKEAVPKDAKVSYKYIQHKRDHNIKVTVTVYSNYKIAKVTGMPVVGNGILHLNQNKYNELNNPNQLINKYNKN